MWCISRLGRNNAVLTQRCGAGADDEGGESVSGEELSDDEADDADARGDEQ